jgi:hypothetical protein
MIILGLDPDSRGGVSELDETGDLIASQVLRRRRP